MVMVEYGISDENSGNVSEINWRDIEDLLRIEKSLHYLFK